MQRYLLDTSALLALRDDEPGADRVAEILALATTGAVRCYGCFVSLMEVLERVWRDESESAGRLAYQQCLSLPIEWVHESEALLIRAAEIKAQHPLSLADAWIAACAAETGAVLLHKHPEFNPLKLAQEVLPFKLPAPPS
ncbi:PIN domain-containing protein [Rhodoferax antarcticus]|uniref:Putative PIN domain-containing nuclease n=1 Tax=Rhodoferax antarcticus ANT.BR TaxID=1111071 RepID=A0A1Q8YK16_9BURK|nr:PIN domain-containing protein [Rhodoferax antarcticus]APW47753.1 VapC toxin family PIN domain ribonuclease [Rhodoferax antarcticus]OLP08297.1 putative PIN domain-containing nuclease [Rhodoferax antarcticus ANT.BR]